jgi:hypothetical protein
VLSACGSSSNAQSGDNVIDGGGENQQDTSSDSNLFYFQGIEKAPLIGDLGPCYVEVKYSDDLSQVTVRAVAPHPHESSAGVIVNLAMGPLIANYNSGGKFYRFQDNADGAPVKDMVLNTSVQTQPTKYGALILHGNHHDPLICESLSGVTTDPNLQTIKDIFSDFENLKAQNP